MVAALDKQVLRKHAVPIDVATYHAMSAHGLVNPRVEFIRGFLIEKIPKSPLHELLTDRLFRVLSRSIGDRCWVRKEGPLSFADSEPEPDVSVVTGIDADYAASHPQTAFLVVEVAVTSEEIDREKGLLYAEAGVAEYWLVLAGQQRIEVHTQPSAAGWGSVRSVGSGDLLAATTLPGIAVAVAEIFPG
jgi:Uma2 family endonuclease